MACSANTFTRMIIKRVDGVPTIPVSDDHNNGDWLDSDVYEGELAMDINTGIVYVRTVNGITVSGIAALKYSRTLTKAEVNAIDSNPVAITAADLGLSSGFGARLSRPWGAFVDNAGTPFSIASSEIIMLSNDASVLSNLGSITDSAITTITNSLFVATNFLDYEVRDNSDLTISASAPITGGGVGSSIRIDIYYTIEAIA